MLPVSQQLGVEIATATGVIRPESRLNSLTSDSILPPMFSRLRSNTNQEISLGSILPPHNRGTVAPGPSIQNHQILFNPQIVIDGSVSSARNGSIGQVQVPQTSQFQQIGEQV